ncbi:MAG: hypothetical protein AAB227_02820 [Pseudomonadota bacterium]
MNSEPKKRSVVGWLAGGGLLSGLGALMGASCCVLPVLLVQIGVSTALVAQLGVLASAKTYLLAITALLIAGGFASAFWGGRRPRPRVVLMLGGAAVLVALSIALPHIEPQLLHWIRNP